MGRARSRFEPWLVVLGSISLAAWSVLAFGDSTSVVPALRSSGAGSAIPLSVSFDLALIFSSPARLASGWALMLAAMMLPVVAAPLRHVRDRSFARRRSRATLLFILGYFAVWMAAGLVLQLVALTALWVVPMPLAMGLAFALAADVTVASQTAMFWAPFSSRGFTPDSGVSWLLPRRVGEVRARKMLLLGEKVDGTTAADWGMIDRCVADDQLEAAADEVAAQLAGSATVAIGLTKMLMHAGQDASLQAHLRNEAFAMELSSRSEDFREGLAAFTEKRAPRFQGR